MINMFKVLSLDFQFCFWVFTQLLSHFKSIISIDHRSGFAYFSSVFQFFLFANNYF